LRAYGASRAHTTNDRFADAMLLLQLATTIAATGNKHWQRRGNIMWRRLSVSVGKTPVSRHMLARGRSPALRSVAQRRAVARGALAEVLRDVHEKHGGGLSLLDAHAL